MEASEQQNSHPNAVTRQSSANAITANSFLSKNPSLRLQHCFLRFNIKPSILQVDQTANQAYFDPSETHTNKSYSVADDYASRQTMNNTAIGGAILDEILVRFN